LEIEDRVFLVTGASSGLGAATARRLLDLGGLVVLSDVNAAGEALATDLGDRASFVKADVCDEMQMADAVEAARRRHGALHGLVNCAGVAPGERVLGKSGPHRLDSFRRTIDINLVGTFNATRLAAQAMTANEPDAGGERGVIVCTASVAAFDGQIGQAAYSASKAAVAGMTLPIARELARFGIRVVTVAPGIFETPMLAAMSPEVQASLGAQVPFPPRLGKPAEYAMLVEQIIVNPMLNAAVIRLDGALRMGAK
jgi:NAD(P)-dependent dehydrogenase (short-subunit alcohol dehydrogenase family)